MTTSRQLEKIILMYVVGDFGLRAILPERKIEKSGM